MLYRLARLLDIPVEKSAAPKPTLSLVWSVRRRDRSLPHFSRKFYHFVSGLICLTLYAKVLTQQQATVILATIGGTWVLLDLGRLKFEALNRYGLMLFGNIMRREELRSLTGNSFYILGLTFVVVVFPKPIALLSILFLAVGDPAAAIVGTLYGKTKLWRGKSLEGALGNLCASGLACAVMGVLYFELPLPIACGLGVVGGLVSMVAELIPLPFDDNFTIPALSGALLSVIFHFFAI